MPPPQSSWRSLFSRRAALTPTPPPSGSIWHKAITGSSRINWRPGAGWQRCLWRGSCVRRQAPEAPGPHVAWLSPVVHSARVRKSGLSRAHGVVVGVMNGDVWMDDRETHDLLLAPTGSGKDTFHIHPTLHWGWTQSTLNLDCQHGEMYDATHAVRAQYGRVEAFAPYRRPLACMNVLRCDSSAAARREFRDALDWAEPDGARKMQQSRPPAPTFANWPRSRLPRPVSTSATRHPMPRSPPSGAHCA